jgi:hypothetical protein
MPHRIHVSSSLSRLVPKYKYKVKKSYMKKFRRLFKEVAPERGCRRNGRAAGLLAGVMSTAMLYSVPAAAQSTVTLYGLVDAGIRYTTHANTAGDSQYQVTACSRKVSAD